MPSTYTLISSNVLSSSAASVTFSAIPSTYTDLVLRISARTDRADANDSINIELNSDSTDSNYSYTRLWQSGTSSGSSRASNRRIGNTDGNNAVSNAFSSGEIYIPNYLVAQNKQIGAFNAGEDNTNNVAMDAVASLWRNTAANTSIKLLPVTGPNFVSGSSFYLYGIKNS